MTDAVLSGRTVAIVGLGLMGGSLGLALAGTGMRRLGNDADADVATRALELGAVDEVGDLAAIVGAADLVVLATPVRGVVELAEVVAGAMRPGAVLTDVGSTKQAICDAFDELDVASIGGHPMCGRELSGPDAATGTLFRDATWALCRTRGTTPVAHALLDAVVSAVGARRVDVDRDVHDEAVATASHLPYVVAQALTGALVEADARTSGIAGRLAATGFRGASRLAGGDVRMWLDVLGTNEAHVRESIGLLRGELDRLEAALDDAGLLEQLLQRGRSAMDAVRVPNRPAKHD